MASRAGADGAARCPPLAAHHSLPPARACPCLQAGVGASMIAITAIYLDDNGKCYIGSDITSQAKCNCELLKLLS